MKVFDHVHELPDGDAVTAESTHLPAPVIETLFTDSFRGENGTQVFLRVHVTRVLAPAYPLQHAPYRAAMSALSLTWYLIHTCDRFTPARHDVFCVTSTRSRERFSFACIRSTFPPLFVCVASNMLVSRVVCSLRRTRGCWKHVHYRGRATIR